MIDINDTYNIHSTISYSKARHMKDIIYEAETKENYFRLVTLKTVHPIDTDFCSYDIAETLDKSMCWLTIIVMLNMYNV